jgi:hypothetical protein
MIVNIPNRDKSVLVLSSLRCKLKYRSILPSNTAWTNKIANTNTKKYEREPERYWELSYKQGHTATSLHLHKLLL